MKKIVLLVYLTVMLGGFAVAKTSWPANQPDCVRWVVQKRMFLIKEQQVEGYNCSIQLRISPGSSAAQTSGEAPTTQPDDVPAGAPKVVSVTIPLKAFDSGEPERDESVANLLGGKASPNLQFKTNPLSPTQWKALESGALQIIDGTLDVARRSLPMTVSIRYDATYLYGTVRTRFSTLRIEPPVVAGGAVAKVRQPLRLEFRLARASLQMKTL